MNANNLNTLRSPKPKGDDDPWEALSKESRPGHLKGGAEEEKGDKPYRARHFRDDSDGQSGEHQPRHLNENAETEGDELYIGAKHLNARNFNARNAVANKTAELVGSIDDINEATERFCRVFKGYETNILEAQNLPDEDKQIYRGNPELIIKNFVVLPLRDAKTPEAQKAVLDSLKEAMRTPATHETDTSKDGTDSAPNKLDGSLEALRAELASQIRARVPENRQAEMIADLQNMPADKLKRVENVLQVMESLKDGEHHLEDLRDHASDEDVNAALAKAGLTPITSAEDLANYPQDKKVLLVDLLQTSPHGVMIFEKIVPAKFWDEATEGLVSEASQMHYADYKAAKDARLADGTYAERLRERQNRQGTAALTKAAMARGWEESRLGNIWGNFANNPKLGEGEARDDAIEAAIDTLDMLNNLGAGDDEETFAKIAENLADYELGADVERLILSNLVSYCGPERIAKIESALKELRGSSDAVQNPSRNNLTIIDGGKKASGAAQRPLRDDLKIIEGGKEASDATASGDSREQLKMPENAKEAWRQLSGINDDARLGELLSHPEKMKQVLLDKLLNFPTNKLVNKIAGLSIRQIAAELEDLKDERLGALMGGVDNYIKGLVFGDDKLREKNDQVRPQIDVAAFREYLAEDRSGDFTDESLAKKVGDLSVGQLLQKIKGNNGLVAQELSSLLEHKANSENSLLAQELSKLLDFYLSNPKSAVHDLTDGNSSKDGSLDLMTTIRIHHTGRGDYETYYTTLGQALDKYRYLPSRKDQSEAVRQRTEIELAMADYPEDLRTKLAKTLDNIANRSTFRKQELLNKKEWLEKMIAMRQEHIEQTEGALKDRQLAGDMKRADIEWSRQSAASDVARFEAELRKVEAELTKMSRGIPAAVADHLQGNVNSYTNKLRTPEEQAKIREGMEQMLAQLGTSEERNRLVDELNRYGLPPEYRDAYMRKIGRTVAMHEEARNSQPAVNSDENAPLSRPSVTGQAA